MASFRGRQRPDTGTGETVSEIPYTLEVTMEERRARQRTGTDFSAQYRTADGSAHDCRITDISPGGMRVVLPGKPSFGESIELDVSFPEIPTIVTVAAVIRWSREIYSERGSVFVSGAEVTAVDAGQWERVLIMVQR